jgi:hypothetical protein
MRGMTRLAGACPLDGRVRPGAAALAIFLAPGLWRNVNVLFVFGCLLALSIRPIAAAAITAVDEVTDAREQTTDRQIAARLTRKVAAEIANPSLRMERALGMAWLPAMHYATQIRA